MHYVARGPEPTGLKKYRDTYTPRWVAYYKRGAGSKPHDSHWRRFRKHLEDSFSGLCGYCECQCKGEVDHFRPKSRFPQRVYAWSNWIFACHDCNNAKGEKWPDKGYIDPCARIRSARPDHIFDFDLKTGFIISKAGLSPEKWKKANAMISELGLNNLHQIKRRLRWISLVSKVLKGEDESDPGHKDFARRFSARTSPLSSVTRVLLVNRGFSENDLG